MTTAEIERDKWKRPLIKPLDGGEPIAYKRPSGLGAIIDNPIFLEMWKMRCVAVGLVKDDTLIDRVEALVNLHDDPISEAKKTLNSITKSALEIAGSKKGANRGNAIHDYVDAMSKGREIKLKSTRWADHLDAYNAEREVNGIKDLASEVFVVCDELHFAGTFDRFVQLEDGRICVDDLKTGASDPVFPTKAAVQLAIYSHSKRYDPATGERTPIFDDFDADVGLLTHLPSLVTPPRCDIYELNLALGWEAAKVAAHVTRLRDLDSSEFIRPFIADRQSA